MRNILPDLNYCLLVKDYFYKMYRVITEEQLDAGFPHGEGRPQHCWLMGRFVLFCRFVSHYLHTMACC